MDKNIVYRGKARIVNLGTEDLPERTKERLPERDRDNAFYLVYDVETDEQTPRRFDVKCEISHRELTGKALEWNRREDGKTPTQIDLTIKDLVKQGLLHRGATEVDLGGALADAHIGRDVFVVVSEDPRGDGTYWPAKARFASPYARLTGAAAADRMAAFVKGTAYTPPAPIETPPPVPAPNEDPDDLPF